MTPVRQAFITDNLEVIAGYRDSKDKIRQWADRIKADFGDHYIYTSWGFSGFRFKGDPLPGWKPKPGSKQGLWVPDRRTRAGKEAQAKLDANPFPGWCGYPTVPGMPKEAYSPHAGGYCIHFAIVHDLSDRLLCAWGASDKVKHDERWRPLKLSEYYALIEAWRPSQRQLGVTSE